MGDAASLAVDIKSKLALWVFRREINFTRWRIEAFRHDDKMVDELLHLRHDVRLWWKHIFPIGHINRPARQLSDHLAQNPNALPHLFDAHQITIVAIAGTADHDIEIVLLVIEIGMFAPQVVLDAARAQN